MKVTIFTSNYAIDDLPFKDDRIGDRISDVERFHTIKMPEESVRSKARINKGADLFTQITKEDEGV